ncbi:PIR Superfamily Protein [Plasmodium ovale curtisi]|uniref:PIR Superfamily Protein n=1 Tax=Plasmodium ovale curtisi TaxID=864141 RepID=A0A1A8XEH7_PLAOA|nr:PIR Superfamily Protein [Plasmodium ovale curtisi]
MSAGNIHRRIGKIFGYSISYLPSERFYQDLKNDYTGLSKYRQKCKEVYALEGRMRNKSICEKILRYLENSEIWKDDDSEYDVCILLNYWIYDTLARIFGADNHSAIVSAFGKLQPLWNELIENEKEPKFYKKCAPDLSIPTQIDWRKSKELYDYYVDFKTIFGSSIYYEDGCREYYKNIEDKISLYEFFEKICTPDSNNCPKFYDKCKPYNPKTVLHNLPCYKQIQEERAAEKTLAMEKSLQHGEHDSPYDTRLTQQNAEIGTRVGHSILGVAPVLLTASVLYKYTPIGSWIRNFGGNNQNSINGMDNVEIDGFLSLTQEPDEMFFRNTENHISYQPM